MPFTFDSSTGTPYKKSPLLEGFTEHWFTTNDGVKLRFLHKGNGMPLIMIPPFDSGADIYSLNAPAFAEEYSVFAVDMRGHGYSDAPTWGNHIFRMSKDLEEFIEFTGAPKVNLLAWSMGCCIVMGYIELFGQDKINKLIWDEQAACLTANPEDSPEERLLYGGADLKPYDVCNAMKRSYEEGMKLIWDVLSPGRPDYELTEEIAKSLPDNYYEKSKLMHFPPYTQANLNFFGNIQRDHEWLDWRPMFSRVSVPVLLTTGDVSIASTPECNEWEAKTFQNCEHIVFTKEDAGIHDLCITAYKKFNKAVLDFLRK